jgi:hypothetical protein
MSYKIGILLGIDSKTALTHWKHFQLLAPLDAATDRPSILTNEQHDQVIEFAVAQFYSMQPVTCARLVWFIHPQYATRPPARPKNSNVRECPSGNPTSACQPSRADGVFSDTAQHHRRLSNPLHIEHE